MKQIQENIGKSGQSQYRRFELKGLWNCIAHFEMFHGCHEFEQIIPNKKLKN
ncbi:MAG: hypothetical protein H6577_17125 [Lewinellaceae bacterium]|nr:hypothetical protein [Saprospiraceae bacterium]MCB9339850.1 hypothetical protein [Lewinellaceae bacterium]